jgi:hypothetical protein
MPAEAATVSSAGKDEGPPCDISHHGTQASLITEHVPRSEPPAGSSSGPAAQSDES